MAPQLFPVPGGPDIWKMLGLGLSSDWILRNFLSIGNCRFPHNESPLKLNAEIRIDVEVPQNRVKYRPMNSVANIKII